MRLPFLAGVFVLGFFLLAPLPAGGAELLVKKPVPIRAQPGTQSQRLAVAPAGSRFVALGPSRDRRWIRIRYRGGSAWVTASTQRVSVRHRRTPPPSAPAPKPPPTERQVEITPALLAFHERLDSNPSWGVFGYQLTSVAPAVRLRWQQPCLGSQDWTMRIAALGNVQSHQLPVPTGDGSVLIAGQTLQAEVACLRRFGGLEIGPVAGAHVLYVQPHTSSYYASTVTPTVGLRLGAVHGRRFQYRWHVSTSAGRTFESFGAGAPASSGEAVVSAVFNLDQELVLVTRSGFELGALLGADAVHSRFRGNGTRAGSLFADAVVTDVRLLGGLILRRGF